MFEAVQVQPQLRLGLVNYLGFHLLCLLSPQALPWFQSPERTPGFKGESWVQGLLGNERWGPEGEAPGFLLRPKAPDLRCWACLVRVGHMEPRHLEVWNLGGRDRSRAKQKLMADRTATEVQGGVGCVP